MDLQTRLKFPGRCQSSLALRLLLVAAASFPAFGQDEKLTERSVRGRVVWSGPLPKLPPILKRNQPARDRSAFAAGDIPDPALQVSDKSGGVANVFIFLPKAPPGYSKGENRRDKELEPARFGLTRNLFQPRGLVLQTNEPLEIYNELAVPTNVHAKPLRGEPFNILISARQERGRFVSYSAAEPYPLSVTSDIHPFLKAWHLPLDHPFGAASDREGRFAFRGLPAGEHTFRVWHELVGRLPDLKITVSEAEDQSPRKRQLQMVRLSNTVMLQTLRKHHDRRRKQYGPIHPEVLKLQKAMRPFQDR